MNWKEKLRIVVEENETPQGRWFDLSIQSLIIPDSFVIFTFSFSGWDLLF
jgi:hypothetical protein